MDNLIVTKGVGMYLNQWNALDEFADKLGLSRSAVLRLIVNRWVQNEEDRKKQDDNDNGQAGVLQAPLLSVQRGG